MVDDVDRRLLAVLVEDGRISVNDLAVRAHVSRATAYTRFDRLRRSDVVKGFRAVVDPEVLGYRMTAVVLVNITQGAGPVVVDAFTKLPGVEWVAVTSGSFDVVIVVRVPSMEALRDTLLVKIHGMAQVHSTQTMFVLDERSLSLGLAAALVSGAPRS